MKQITIKDPADWRAGDHLRATYPDGSGFDGTLVMDDDGDLRVGFVAEWVTRYGLKANWTTDPDMTITVTRTRPELPTKPGSVIYGDPNERYVLDEYGSWYRATPIPKNAIEESGWFL